MPLSVDCAKIRANIAERSGALFSSLRTWISIYHSTVLNQNSFFEACYYEKQTDVCNFLCTKDGGKGLQDEILMPITGRFHPLLK